jgi:hypothetical protein
MRLRTTARFILVAGLAALAMAAAPHPAVAATSGDSPPTGTWRAKLPRGDGRVELKLSARQGDSEMTTRRHLSADAFEGLDPEDFSRFSVAYRFSWKSDAGTIRFEGRGRWWRGSGSFTFEPDPGYVRRLIELGYREPSDFDLLRLTLDGISRELLEGFQAIGYTDLDLGEVMRLSRHGLDMAYIHDAQRLGYRPDLDDLVRLRNHRIGGDEIREYADRGLVGIPPDDLIRLHNHRIGPEWVAGMVEAGYSTSDVDDLIRLRSHRVQPERVARLRAIERLDLSTEQIVRLTSHRVAADYVEALAASDLADLSVDEIIRLHSHRVPTEYVTRLAGMGYDRTESLIRMHDHRVSADEVAELHAIGYGHLGPDELIRLETHRVTPDFVKRLVDAGYEDLTVDELIDVKNRGISETLLRKKSA